MKKSFIRIGNITITFESEDELRFDENLQKFLWDEVSTKSECIYSIEKLPFNLSMEYQKVSDEYVKVYAKSDKVLREYIYADMEENRCGFLEKDIKVHNRYKLYIDPRTESFIMRSNFIPLDEILAYRGGVLLHCSCVVYKGQAVLFSAPSGTGKTTQARLWAKYAGATIVNGDRCAVMRIDGKWCACGSFYKGSSEYCENVIVPIAAIITLEQGSENKSYSLNNFEKFSALYRESIVHTWNSEYVELLADTIIECVKEIKMEHFVCIPKESAVWYIEKLIYG